MTDEEKLEMMLYIDEVIKKYFQEELSSKSKELEKAVIDKAEIELKTSNLVDRLFGKQKIKDLTESVPKLIESYLRNLSSIKDSYAENKKELIDSLHAERTKILLQAKEGIIKEIEAQKEEIAKIAGEAYEFRFFIENYKNKIIEEVVRAATNRVREEDSRPKEIHIVGPSETQKLKAGIYHEKFEDIYKFTKMGLPVMLIGPTGSGKNICANQIADALELQMYYTNNASEEYKLLGFTDGYGKYKETQFYKAFKNGGLFVLDEVDNSHPSALLALNSAIGASAGRLYMAFEDGNFTEAHRDFRIIALANTWGNGASRIYCGRSELDGASLDRFIQIYFDYDKKIEKSIVSDDDLLNFFWDYRKIITDCGIRHTVTTRNISYAQSMKDWGFSVEQILLYTVIKELDFEDLKIITQRFKDEGMLESEYTKGLNEIVLKRI